MTPSHQIISFFKKATLFAFAFFCLTITQQVNSQQKNKQQPNIIVILSDDMGYSDIGCFGSEIRTPNIDKLASRGLRFTQFYNTARCSPSRAALLTGLYPHQAGMGHLSSDNYPTIPGYVDDLSKNAVTMAEVLGKAGYATYMTGKWHISKNLSDKGDLSNWPIQRGFQRFFGTLNGSGSYYDPGTLTSNNTFIAPGKDFYYTNAISDTAVKYIKENPKQKPFFLYVAYTAGHWPLHAPENEIQKYKGVYDKGWDILREQRFNRLKKAGIISANCVLTPRGVEIPEWKDEPLKDWQIRRMQVFAAMVDIMDQGIGKIITTLEQKGILDNTIIFYMQDNGGCAETQGTDQPEVQPTAEQAKLKPFSYDSVFTGKKPLYSRDGRWVRNGIGVMPGDANTFSTYGMEWANVSNTPYRLYKHWTHEGGIATPLVVHWPKGIIKKGEIRNQPGHLIDIMATCLAITGVQYPTKFNGNEIQPFEGKNLVPAFNNLPIVRKFIFWEHEGNRAIRTGNWKLVSTLTTLKKFTAADENKWELYDLQKDPSELNNLATKFPEKVKELAQLWEQEAIRTKAKPWPWGK